MNEQIKQLLGQAYDEAVPETWTTLSSLQQGRVYEKFAELIVRECVSICESGTSTQTTSSGAAQMIKQHFGIESWNKP